MPDLKGPVPKKVLANREIVVRLTRALRTLTGLELKPKTERQEGGGLVVDADNPIEKDIARAAVEGILGSDAKALRHIGRLRYYRKHLLEVELSSSVELEQLTQPLRRSGEDPPNFYGAMFEIEIAASLARKGIPFEKQERPDFKTQILGEPIGIECTTGRIDEPSKKVPLEKIENRVAVKACKSYMSPSDVVFVDATPVHYTSGDGGKVRMDKPVEADVKGALSAGVHRGNASAAVAFVRMYHEPTGTPETIYYRVDHLGIEQPTKRLLDLAYPFGTGRPIDMQNVHYLIQE